VFPFEFESLLQNLFGILKSDQNKSCRALQDEQLLFWEFHKFLRKIKSNFGISILPKFKLNLPQFGILNFKLFWLKSPFSFQNMNLSLKVILYLISCCTIAILVDFSVVLKNLK